MIFNSSTVKRYILNGAEIIATIRKSGQYKLDQKVVIKLGDKRFHGKVIAVAPLTLFSLSEYVEYSGFETIEEWLNEAEKLHKTRLDPSKFEIVVVKVARS